VPWRREWCHDWRIILAVVLVTHALDARANQTRAAIRVDKAGFRKFSTLRWRVNVVIHAVENTSYIKKQARGLGGNQKEYNGPEKHHDNLLSLSSVLLCFALFDLHFVRRG
jgi:hypothetical protein